MLLSAGILLLMDLGNLGSSFLRSARRGEWRSDGPQLRKAVRRYCGSICSGFRTPRVYIAILPGMGVALAGSGRPSRVSPSSRIQSAMVYAMLSIGFFWLHGVPGHHMFMSGMSPYSPAFAFSILTM